MGSEAGFGQHAVGVAAPGKHLSRFMSVLLDDSEQVPPAFTWQWLPLWLQR